MQHPYCDHAIDTDNVEEEVETKSTTGSDGGVQHQQSNFPAKLFQMLEHIDLHEPSLANIVSWQPHGRSFLVRDANRFEEVVLPRFFFNQSMYSSFRRQLNQWGFKRLVQTTPDHGAYYHEFFLRSKAFLYRHISRNRQRGMKDHQRGRTYNRAVSNPNGEPNFYSSMAYLPPSSFSSTANGIQGTAAGVSDDGAPPLPMLPSVSPRGDNESNTADAGERWGSSVDDRFLTTVRSSSSLLVQQSSSWRPERPSSPVLYCSTTVPTLGSSSGGRSPPARHWSSASADNACALDSSSYIIDNNENGEEQDRRLVQLLLERFCAVKQQGSVRDTVNEAPHFARPLQTGAAFFDATANVEAQNGYECSACLSSGGTNNEQNDHRSSLNLLEPFRLGNAPPPSLEENMEILNVVGKIDEGSAYLSSGGIEKHDYYSSLDLEPFRLGNAPTPTFEEMMEILTVIRKIV